jgi:hypothetical protein
MALVSLSLDNFESLILNDYAEDGYQPMSLAEIQEHEQAEDILKILKAVKGDFNKENTFCINVQHGSAAAVYGFSLIQKAGKPVLQFGANSQTHPQNEVEVTVETIKGEDDDETIVFKAGKATITYDRLDRSKADSKPVFLLKFGKAMVGMYVKLAGEEVNTQHFEKVEAQADLTNLLGTLGTVGVKLTDIVRPYAKQGCKGILPKPLNLEITSWEIQPPHPEYGTSVLFNIRGLELALRENGESVKNPGAIFVNSNQVSAQLIQKPTFAQQALLHKYYQGGINLVITAVNAKNPERNMPTNVLKCVKPSNPVMAAALEKALELSKQGIPFEAIMQQVPVPSQNAIAASDSVAADIFPVVEKVSETVTTNGKVKELVTVGAKASVVTDDVDLEDF